MQQLSSGVSVWRRRSLLLKLSEQTQLLEELAEISVDRLGAVTSAADGRCQQVFTMQCCFQREILQFRAISMLLFKYCMYNSYQATKRGFAV